MKSQMVAAYWSVGLRLRIIVSALNRARAALRTQLDGKSISLSVCMFPIYFFIKRSRKTKLGTMIEEQKVQIVRGIKTPLLSASTRYLR